MRVLFLEIDAEPTWALAAIGPAFIAAYLRRHGHEASLHRVPLDATYSDVVAAIKAVDPGLIAVSLTTRQWLRARDVIRAVRTVIDVPVIAGGLHPTFAAEEVLSNPGFDYVCLGEGEEPMLDVIRHLLRHGRDIPDGAITNIWVRGGRRPTLRAPIANLDELPFMARDMLDERYGVRYFCTQRGCPFPCTYCAARKYDDLYEGIGDYGRRRSHENVLAELSELEQNGGISYVIFLDDTFTIHRPWVLEFCRRYGETVRKPFSLHARVETVTPDVLQALAAAGCHQITYGVESGSFRVRKEVMKRPVQNQKFIDVFQWTRDVGINATANYMLGLPDERPEDVEQTLALAEQLAVPDFGYFVFYPYPGTHLFQVCKQKGYLPEDYLERPANHRESILRLPDLTPDDIGRFYDRFTALRTRLLARRSPGTLASRAKLAAQIRATAAAG
jgi:anaerobic magnesium-protoporphyrin IX monomethyl ester cyclase